MQDKASNKKQNKNYFVKVHIDKFHITKKSFNLSHQSMSTRMQSTPNRMAGHSPQLYTRSRRKSPSPYSRHGETIIKSILSTKRTTEQFSQKNQKIRQLQSQKSRLEQRLGQSQQQNIALQQTLKQRIQMYKRILKQKQQKSQSTLQSLQAQFKLQFNQLSQQKQQEEKFFQQQSQILGQRIQLLQGENFQLEQKLSNQISLYSGLTAEIEKLNVVIEGMKGQYQDMIGEKNQQIQKLQNTQLKLQHQLKQQQIMSKDQIQHLTEKQTLQLSTLQQKLQTQLKSLQHLRNSQNQQKHNQITQLKRLLQTQRLKFSHTVEAEQLRYDHLLQTQNLKSQNSIDQQSRRLMQMLSTRQQSLDMLNRDVSQMQATIDFMRQQNAHLKTHIAQLQTSARQMQQQALECKQLSANQRQYQLQVINELKQQIKLNQINYIRQRDKNGIIYQDNLMLQQATGDRELLLVQINQLKQLLVESSKEIEKCRERFLAYERENKKLLFQLDRVQVDNNSLLRIRRQLEEEAIKWRQNYIRAAR